MERGWYSIKVKQMIKIKENPTQSIETLEDTVPFCPFTMIQINHMCFRQKQHSVCRTWIQQLKNREQVSWSFYDSNHLIKINLSIDLNDLSQN